MGHEVFISYSTVDKTTADATCAILESMGIRCWVAPRDIAPGITWSEGIVESVDASRAMVLIFSAASNISEQVKREVERALSKGVTIVPFRIEDVVPSKHMQYYIGCIHWLDALTPPLESHIKRLGMRLKSLLSEDRPNLDTTRRPSGGDSPTPRSAARTHSVAKAVASLAVCPLLASAIGVLGYSARNSLTLTSVAGNGKQNDSIREPSITGAVSAAPGAVSEPTTAGGSSARQPTATPATGQRAVANPGPPADGVKPALVFENTIGMKLALIPAGNFMMGSPDSDLSADDATEKPQQRVNIERPFYLGVHEVTQAQYQAVMDDNPTHFARGDDLPVLIPRTTWKSAVQFCNRLSEKEKVAPYYRFGAEPAAGGDGYRLPTEAEWEYACRAGRATPYPFDEKAHPLGDYAWYASNSARKPHPVGQKRPNDFGLYDMLGNASEVCDSVFVPFKPPVIAPLDLSLQVIRVPRGGNWMDPPSKCRSANRRLHWEDSDGSWSMTGFRIAQNVPAAKPAHPANVKADVAPKTASEPVAEVAQPPR